jgi:hypothetical protein
VAITKSRPNPGTNYGFRGKHGITREGALVNPRRALLLSLCSWRSPGHPSTRNGLARVIVVFIALAAIGVLARRYGPRFLCHWKIWRMGGHLFVREGVDGKGERGTGALIDSAN